MRFTAKDINGQEINQMRAMIYVFVFVMGGLSIGVAATAQSAPALHGCDTAAVSVDLPADPATDG